VRDPHILRKHDNTGFYMVATDMRSPEGWKGNYGIVLLRSRDLVNWESSKVDIRKVFPKFDKINRAWAPQTIYDAAAGKYMVYWSMRAGRDPDVIYYSYANDDFTALESEPQVLYNSPNNKACIDGDIIEKDGKYYLFHKTEGDGNGIKVAVANEASGPYALLSNNYVNQTREAVEGSCTFKLIDSDKYILMYDVYRKGRYEFCETTDFVNFKVINEEVSMDFKPRHGTVMTISAAEKQALMAKWGQDK